MKIIRCDNEHFYDSDKYDHCPHCNETQNQSHINTDTPNKPFKVINNDPSLPKLPVELLLFTLTEKLGQGSTSNVYRLSQNKEYAVKVISIKQDNLQEMAKNEYSIGRSLSDSKYFPTYYGLYETDSNIFIVQDIMQSWHEYTHTHIISDKIITGIIKDILLALIALEKRSYQHMDIKTSNIFVDETGHAKLGDFSHSKKINTNEKHLQICGTPRYIAPEISSHEYCSGKEDMYSFGITMYKLLSGGKYPYENISDAENPYRSKNDKIIYNTSISEEMMNIILKATAYNPQDRYKDLYELLGEYIAVIDSLPDDRYLYSEELSCQDDADGFQEDCYTVALCHEFSNRTIPAPEIVCDSGESSIDSGSSIKSYTKVDQVRFSAFTDKSVHGDDYGVIEICMYEDDEYQDMLDAIQEEFNNSFKTKIFDKANVELNQRITVKLSSREVDIEDNIVEKTWMGEYISFTFDYYVPKEYRKNRIPFIADVYFDGVPATKLKFFVDKKDDTGFGSRESCSDFHRCDIQKAFISYASQDRNRVTAIIQGLLKARPDMDIFFDVDNLRSGDNWEKSYIKLWMREMYCSCVGLILLCNPNG